MRLKLVSTVVIAGLVLGACSSGADNEQAASAEATTFDNCGVNISISEPPQRASTLEQGSTDTLLLLGAKDQMVGYGHQKDAPPKGYDLEGLKEISPSVPTSEQLRDADTDFILSPFEASFTPDMAGPRQEWSDLKVPTYVSNTECPDHGDNAGKSTFELLERDLTELGQIFGREDEAAALIKKQQDSLKNSFKAPEGTTFLMLYSSVGGSPYVAGGPSIVTEMGNAVGMKNAFANVDEEWPQVSWEAIAEANPDVIILGDLPARGEPGDKWQEKAADLENNPGTKEMDAVRNKRYIVIPGVTASASARSLEAVDLMSKALQDGIAEKKAN